ncbi:MAG: HAD family phosphatase [Lachnospiraceae bacterium]|nr:HAD family phosphatase [Lachnospiraceae bacterium]
MKEFKGAIFDLDGTILDSMWVWKQVDVNFLGKRGIEISADYVKAISALNLKTAAEYTKERFQLPETVEEIMQEWFQMAVKEYAEDVQLKSSVREYLAYLKAKEVKIAVATSSHEGLFLPCLENNEIYEFFDTIVTTMEVERGKEFPDVYEEAARRLGVKPSQCMVFEDILKGVKAAKEGGFYVVAVGEEHSQDEKEEIMEVADRYIEDFDEMM